MRFGFLFFNRINAIGAGRTAKSAAIRIDTQFSSVRFHWFAAPIVRSVVDVPMSLVEFTIFYFLSTLDSLTHKK